MDNGSVYTQSLIELLEKKKIQFERKTSHFFDLNCLKNYNSIILSGRRKNEKRINEINSKIINFSIETDTKLLGICYGAEILALTLGGTIRKTFPQKGDELVKILKENSEMNGKFWKDLISLYNVDVAVIMNKFSTIEYP